MRIKIFILAILSFSTAFTQQLEFLYTNQQLNVFNFLTNDIPIFTQNFDDQVSAAVPITPFTMGGQAYNTVFISSNGFVTLGQAASSTNYNPISQPPGMPVIAPFACNLESANSNSRVSYSIVTGFNNVPRSIIIQWKDVRRLGKQGESFSFQVELKFSVGIMPGIDFIYGDFSSVNSSQSPIEIGIRIGSGSASTQFQNFQINNGGTWVPQQFGTSPNSTCLFPSTIGSAGVPPSGMVHPWILLFPNPAQVNTSPICNQNGNVVIYSNYDGGTLNINCDQNIPNLKIGICTYEPVLVNISGPFVGNVIDVLYAGFNSSANNNHCGLGNITTAISGVNSSIVQILTAPPLNFYPTHQNGQAYQSGVMVGVGGQCDTIYVAGGGNTPDEVVGFFLNTFGGNLRFHHTSYNCWATEIYDLSEGGTCCTDPFNNMPIWDISISNDTTVCSGGNVSPSLLANNNGVGPFSYSWKFDGQELSQQPSFNFNPSSDGIACLTVWDANGDSLTKCLNITVIPPIQIQFSIEDTLLCWPGAFAVINETNPNDYSSHIWLINNSAFADDDTLNFTPMQPGVYTIELQVVNALGCVFDTLISSNLVSLASPIAQFSNSPENIQSDNPLVSFADASLGGVVLWNWTFMVPPSPQGSTQQNPQFLFSDSLSGDVEVLLVVKNQNGCSDSAIKTISIIENSKLFIPNSFTPDGNGLNDVFMISGIGLERNSFQLEIYSRWGELIFASNDIDKGWDGRHWLNHSQSQQGTYVYRLIFRYKNQSDIIEKIGQVNLIR